MDSSIVLAALTGFALSLGLTFWRGISRAKQDHAGLSIIFVVAVLTALLLTQPWSMIAQAEPWLVSVYFALLFIWAAVGCLAGLELPAWVVKLIKRHWR